MEFIGLPGSGKTSIAAEVVKKLKSGGCNILTLESMIDEYGGGANRPIIAAILLLKELRKRRNRLILTQGLRYTLDLGSLDLRRLKYCLTQARMAFMTYQAVVSSNHHYLILDQGFLQTLWALILHGISGEDQRLSVSLPHRDELLRVIRVWASGFDVRVVYVDIPPRVAIERITQRTHQGIPFPRLSAELRLEAFKRYSGFFKTILEVVEYLGIKSVSVDGLDSLERNVDRVYDLISPCNC